MKLKQGIGSSFDDFLQEEGMLAEAEAIAVKRVIAFQIEETMSKEHRSFLNNLLFSASPFKVSLNQYLS